MTGRQQHVVVGMSGGLGNQMFQYAAGRSLAARLGVPLILDISWFADKTERQFALTAFQIEATLCYQFEFLPASGRKLISRLSRRWMSRILDVPVWREPHFHYSNKFTALSQPVFLEGYWQSERYFHGMRSHLLREFSLNKPLPSASEKLLNEIKSCDAICVHIRRGDYLTNPVAAKVHGICTEDYYYKGVAELCQGLTRPHCYVFSDDPAWVHANITFDCPMKVIDINGPQEAYFDITLMAACTHFLIANSSLSWWGAWMGGSTIKKVIAPLRWFLDTDKDTKDLLPESWILR